MSFDVGLLELFLLAGSLLLAVAGVWSAKRKAAEEVRKSRGPFKDIHPDNLPPDPPKNPPRLPAEAKTTEGIDREEDQIEEALRRRSSGSLDDRVSRYRKYAREELGED